MGEVYEKWPGCAKQRCYSGFGNCDQRDKNLCRAQWNVDQRDKLVASLYQQLEEIRRRFENGCRNDTEQCPIIGELTQAQAELRAVKLITDDYDEFGHLIEPEAVLPSLAARIYGIVAEVADKERQAQAALGEAQRIISGFVQDQKDHAGEMVCMHDPEDKIGLGPLVNSLVIEAEAFLSSPPAQAAQRMMAVVEAARRVDELIGCYAQTGLETFRILESHPMCERLRQALAQYRAESCPAKEGEGENPCADCGMSRTKEEGGEIFTLCVESKPELDCVAYTNRWECDTCCIYDCPVKRAAPKEAAKRFEEGEPEIACANCGWIGLDVEAEKPLDPDPPCPKCGERQLYGLDNESAPTPKEAPTS